MGLFDKKNCDICGDKIGFQETVSWIMAICARIVPTNSPRGLKKDATVQQKTSKDSWHTEKKIKMLYVILVSLVNFPQTDTMYLSTITKACLLWHLT